MRKQSWTTYFGSSPGQQEKGKPEPAFLLNPQASRNINKEIKGRWNIQSHKEKVVLISATCKTRENFLHLLQHCAVSTVAEIAKDRKNVLRLLHQCAY